MITIAMPEKVKVIQIIKTLNVGGAERFAIELAKALDRSIFDVKLIAFFKDNTPVESHRHDELAGNQIEVNYLTAWKGNNHIPSYVNAIIKMRKLLKTTPADILHSHFQLGTLGAIYCRNKGLARKVIRTAHNHPRKEWELGAYGSLRHEIIGKWIYPKQVDAVVAVSSSIAEELSNQPGTRRHQQPIQTIYNAISAEIISQSEVNIKQHEYPGPIIGTIGRLTPQKGYIHFMRAIPQILNSFPGAQFWFIGDGEEQTTLDNEALRLQIADQVKFLGKLPNVYATLREMDVFVLPSLWEGLPTVLLESIANNVPVVATNIPGNCEIIQDEDLGWLVPPKDPAALAEAIITALREPELRMRRAKRAKESLNRFLIERIAKQYEDLYLDLLDQGYNHAR